MKMTVTCEFSIFEGLVNGGTVRPELLELLLPLTAEGEGEVDLDVEVEITLPCEGRCSGPYEDSCPGYAGSASWTSARVGGIKLTEQEGNLLLGEDADASLYREAEQVAAFAEDDLRW